MLCPDNLLVKADPVILVPIFSVCIVAFLSIFPFLIHDTNRLKRWFLYGMLVSFVLLAALISGSQIKESDSISGFLVTLSLLLEGAMLYAAFLFLILIASLKSIFSIRHENKGTFFMLGIGFIFVMFELVLALQCPETIPFVENVVKPKC